MNDVEVVQLIKDGLQLNGRGEELFLSFKDYPYFQAARVSSLFNVELLHGIHLRWPRLDVDLELDCVRNPAAYPVRMTLDENVLEF